MNCSGSRRRHIFVGQTGILRDRPRRRGTEPAATPIERNGEVPSSDCVNPWAPRLATGMPRRVVVPSVGPRCPCPSRLCARQSSHQIGEGDKDKRPTECHSGDCQQGCNPEAVDDISGSVGHDPKLPGTGSVPIQLAMIPALRSDRCHNRNKQIERTAPLALVSLSLSFAR